jgi:hypothetical protein
VSPPDLARVLATLDKLQASPLPPLRVRAKPGELTQLRALADLLRAELAVEPAGRHRAPLDSSQGKTYSEDITTDRGQAPQ